MAGKPSEVTVDDMGHRHYRLFAETGHLGIAPGVLTQKHVPLRCGRCGGRNFSVIVRTGGDAGHHRAKVTGALCACGHLYPVGETGVLEDTGERTVEFRGV